MSARVCRLRGADGSSRGYLPAVRYKRAVKESQLDVFLARAVKVLLVLVLVPIVIHLWGALTSGYTNDTLFRIATGRS